MFTSSLAELVSEHWDHEKVATLSHPRRERQFQRTNLTTIFLLNMSSAKGHICVLDTSSVLSTSRWDIRIGTE